MKDLTGQRFGKLVAVEPTRERKDHHVVWRCQCDCGSVAYIPVNSLTRGKTKSCGCLRRNRKDLTGKRFGRLVVVSYSHTDKHRASHWNTRCDCGNVVVVCGNSLKRGDTKSCGCLHKEIMSILAKKMVGHLSPHWNPELTDEERKTKRNFPEYKEWRGAVYERDEYTCQKCGDSIGGNLNAHHIEGYADNPELRTEVSNGITLCKECHNNFHHLYGNHSTREMLEAWLGNL